MTSHFHTPSHHPHLPKVGETRCYWFLLSADLKFLFVDPVLSKHLESESNEILGKNLLDFVHPDEVDNARNDLGNIVAQRGLHGSVTSPCQTRVDNNADIPLFRVRYCRLSTVRTRLGFRATVPSGSLYEATFPDARKIAYDEHYMACEIVLNWAADHPNMAKFGGGILLCFLHAVVDINTVSDNDERHKTSWSNWCSTPVFEREHAEALHNKLIADTPATSFSPSDTPPSRVFQIIANVPDRHVLFSWPPTVSSAAEFAKLAKDVQIDTASTTARTGCQRRFQAQDMILGKEVESIFIPHGSIIFACHTLSGDISSSSGMHGPVSMNAQQPFYSVNEPQNQGYYDVAYNHSRTSNDWQPNRSPYPSTSTSSPLDPLPAKVEQWNAHTHSPSPPTPAHSPTTTTPYSASWGISAATTSPPVQPAPAPAPQPQKLSTTATSEATPARGKTVRQISRSDPNLGHQVGHGSKSGSASQSTGRTSSGHPPVGVTNCASCKTTSSPEWRKGPSGKKELCNACGLRYARSRARKDGHAPQKRRKDDKSTATSPVSPSGPGATISQTTPSPQSSSFSHQSQAQTHSHSQSLDFHPQRRSTSDHQPVAPYEPVSEQKYTMYSERTRTPSPPVATSMRERGYDPPATTHSHETEEYEYGRQDHHRFNNVDPASYYTAQSSSMEQMPPYTSHGPTSHSHSLTSAPHLAHHAMLPRIATPDMTSSSSSSTVPALPPFGIMTRPLNGSSGGIPVRTESPVTYDYRFGQGHGHGHAGYAIAAPSSYERGSTQQTPVGTLHQPHDHRSLHIPTMSTMRHSTGA